jgi:hypothetical protein
MKRKSLMMALGALGMLVMVPVVNVAFAEISTPEALAQSPPAMSPEAPSTGIIDISIDANQDGVSDELLAETLKVQAIADAENERLQAIDSTDDEAFESFYEVYSATITAANIQLVERLPWDDDVRQILAQLDQVGDQYELYLDSPYGEGGPEQSAIEAELRQLGEKLDQNPNYLEVIDAQQKVYAFIEASR